MISSLARATELALERHFLVQKSFNTAHLLVMFSD